MLRYPAALRTGALAGTAAGAAVGLAGWSQVWPRLSLMAAMRAAALGWLAGLVISSALVWIPWRRARARKSRGGRWWHRMGGAALTAAALAPPALWAALAMPPAPAQRAMDVIVRRADPRPNIVLITVDALRADHLGAYGSSAGLTPSLDAFSREATRYDAAYASSPWTMPSLGSLLSAQPPSACGLKTGAVESKDWYTDEARLPESVPVLAERLRRVGYTTAAELTNPFLSEERGWRRGFDHFRNEDEPDVKTLLTSQTARADTVTANARLWLRMNRREPFFLWVHYLDPHTPYASPDEPPGLRSRYPAGWDTARPYWHDIMRHASEETKSRYADLCRETYSEEVRYADRWVGELLAELKQLRGYRGSLVVVTADHGEELFDHGAFEHGHAMHEEVLRVPLLVKWPEGWRADRRVSQTVGLIDLTPTFLRVAQAEPMAGVRGRILPTEDGGQGAEVYSEALLHGPEQTALTTDEYKVICRPYGGPDGIEFEVYDRRRDRAELRDLSGGRVASELRGRLWAQTAAAQVLAVQWPGGEAPGSGQRRLSEETRRKLAALGYVGD